mgnify:CR=1 FL=1
MKKIIITIGKNSQTIFLLIVLVIGLVILLNTIAFFYKKHKNPRFSQKEFLNNIFYTCFEILQLLFFCSFFFR